MSLALYTVTVDGSSQGNAIKAPFDIEIIQMAYVDETDPYTGEIFSKLIISPCTRNSAGEMCKNDDIPDRSEYDLPVMTSSKNTDLSNSIEQTFNTVYGAGNWSKQ